MGNLVGANGVAALVVFPDPDDEGDETAETQEAADREEGDDGERDENRAEEQQNGRREQERDGGAGEDKASEREHGADGYQDGHEAQHLSPVERRILLRPKVQLVRPLLQLWSNVRHRHCVAQRPATVEANSLSKSAGARDKIQSPG